MQRYKKMDNKASRGNGVIWDIFKLFFFSFAESIFLFHFIRYLYLALILMLLHKYKIDYGSKSQ